MTAPRQASSTESLDGKRLLLLAALVVGGVVFWDFRVLWPLKMLVVMIHETGHALASLLVGGSVTRVTIASNQSGECLSQIPLGFFAKVAVYSAGYVGSALASAVLMIATFRFQARRVVLGAACVWLSAMAIFYAGDGFTLLFCLGTALVLGLGAKYLPASAVELFNLFIAAFCALYAAMDLKDDLWNSEVRARSDAALLSNVTLVPAVVWAALWTALSLAILVGSGWWAVRRRRRLAAAAASVERPAT
ncbi:MAG: M50 family metallopeptidase [Myxococcaceae bacterium]